MYVVRPTASLTVNAGHGLLLNDTDVGGAGLTVMSYTQPRYGSISVAPDGSFVFTGPSTYDAAFFGHPPGGGDGGEEQVSNTFSYTVKDASGASTTGTA